MKKENNEAVSLFPKVLRLFAPLVGEYHHKLCFLKLKWR